VIGFGKVIGWRVFQLTQLYNGPEKSSITISIGGGSGGVIIVVIPITCYILQFPKRGRKFES